MPRKRLLAAGGAVAALALLTGCGQLDNSNASASTSSSAPSSSAPAPAPTSSATSTPAPTTTTTPATTSPRTHAAAPGGSGTCQPNQLDVSLGQAETAAGTTHRPLKFTNTSQQTCVIQGFPGVSYVGGDNGTQIGPAAKRIPPKGDPVHLAPGQSASAEVGFTQVYNFPTSKCHPTPVRGLRVYPPHDYSSKFVPLQTTGCAGNPPDPQLTVKTVQ